MSHEAPPNAPLGYEPPPGDPKAAAAAAKAYAKATRPWYKKKRWILGGGLAALVVIAVITSGGGGDDKGTQGGVDQSPATSGSQKEGTDTAKKDDTAEQPAANTPDNSSKGNGPITWGNWQVVGKIQVKDNGLNMYDVVARVKNTGQSVDQGIFTVTILKGNNILGTADCTTSDVNPGAIATASCFSTDDFTPGWTEITIENSF